MAETEYLALDATINTSKWDAAVNKMLGDAARIESMLSGLEAQFAGFGDALSDIDISVTADVDDSAVADFTAELDSVPDAVETNLSAVEDSSGVEGFISAVDEVPDSETSLLAAESDTSGIDDFIGVWDEIPEEKTAEVKPKVDSGGLSMLDSLATKLTGINSAIELIQTGFGALGTGINLAGQLIQPIVDADDAMAVLESQTGKTFPEMEAQIKAMYQTSDSASMAQIAQVAATAIQWGVAEDQVMSMTGSVLDFADTFDKDAMTTLAAFDSMIKSGMVSDAQEAFDLLTIAIQGGADKGGDLLSTITNQAGALKEMGFTGQEVVSGIISGIQAGLPAASSVVDMIRGLVRSEGGAGTETIDVLGLGDEQAARDAGTITGGEYVTAVLTALSEQAPDVQKELAQKLFGRAAGTVGVTNIMGLDFAQNLTDEIEGAGAAAAAAADNTIRSALTILGNTISVEVANILDSKFDIQGWLDKIKGAVQTFSAEIQAGEGLFGALEVALEMPGLEDKVQRIESAINNFLIGLLDAVANIGEFLGSDVGGLRDEVARLQGGQLAFDLKVATDEEGIKNSIQTALDRGVAAADIGTAVMEATMDLTSEGDVTRATMILDTFKSIRSEQTASTEEIAATIAKLEELVEKSPGVAEGMNIPQMLETLKLQQVDLTPAETAITTTMTATLDNVNAARTTLDSTTAAIGTALTTMQETGNSAKFGWNFSMSEMVWNTDSNLNKIDTAINETSTGFAAAGSDMQMVATETGTVIAGYFQGIVEKSNPAVATIYEMANAWNAVTAAINGAVGAGGGKPGEGGEVPGHAAGGYTRPGFFMAGEQGPEAIFSDKSLAVLNNQTTDALFTALRTMGGMGGGVTNNRTTNANMPVTINVQNTAQGNMAGQQIINQMRGF